MIGELRLKLTEQVDNDAPALTVDILDENQADPPDTVKNQQSAVYFTGDEDPSRSAHLFNLGTAQKTRFERLGDLTDLEIAISNLEKAISLTGDGHPDKPVRLSALAQIYETRFEHLGDLENVISNLEKAISLTGDGHPDKPDHLSMVARIYEIRFDRLGGISDIENSISNAEKAVELTDDTHPHKARFICNLGIAQHRRFLRLGNFSDLEKALLNKEMANNLIDNGDPKKQDHLASLCASQLVRFQHIGDLSDLESAVSNGARAVELADDEHPDKPMYLAILASGQELHFKRLGDVTDLDNATSNMTKAIQLTPEGCPEHSFRLSSLGVLQQTRFERFGNLSNLTNAIANQEQAIELMDIKHRHMPQSLSCLSVSLFRRFEHLGNSSDLENAISNLEKAVALTNDGYADNLMYRTNLASYLDARFQHYGDSVDLDNAILNMTIAMELTSHGDGPIKASHLLKLGHFQLHRFERFGDHIDLENAVTNNQRAIELTEHGDPKRPGRLSSLGITQYSRFIHAEELSHLENAITNIEEAAELTDDGNPDKLMYLINLGCCQLTRFKHLRNLSDLQNAVSNMGKAVGLTDDSHPLMASRLMNLGVIQRNCFEALGCFDDLENALSNLGKADRLTDDSHPSKADRLINLGIAQKAHFDCCGDQVDLVACVSSFKEAAQLKSAYPPHALQAARRWAQTSHHNGDLSSALEGYRTALKLLPKVAWLGINSHSRQHTLLQEKSENLGCLAATCAIQLGHLEEAVELLDLGRSVFWQQASSLRSDLVVLREEDAELAGRFEKISQQLDESNFSGLPFATGSEQRNAEQNGQERRRLVREWEELLESIRKLPRLKYFLRSIPFRQLREVSMTGQVVIINVSTYRVDALIFGIIGPVDHVSLSNIDPQTLAELSENIVLNQPINASETIRRRYITRFMKPALRTIWDDILVHVFRKLHITSGDNMALPQHRIWWYLTGPLTFIPIHAAGSGNGAIDVSRVVISSYVTTLESLLRGHYKSVAIGQGKLLSVSQPKTPGQNSLPQAMDEVNDVIQVFKASGLSKDNIVCLHGSEATVDAVSSALNSCSWVHLACHAFQDQKMGMQSAFSFHDGHLELSEVASKKLPNSQFAFLSACQSASGQKDIPGEAMHLAAGLQFAGFPSVIATMWNIRDDDAPKVAAHTYEYLLRNGIEGVDLSDAAIALNRAILRLREDPCVTVGEWAPFIHFGI